MLVLMAEVDGEVVGAGRASLNTWTSEEGAADVSVMVHPDRRGRGAGRQLYDSLEWHLRDVGARRVEGWADDDEASERGADTAATSAATRSATHASTSPTSTSCRRHRRCRTG